jgi:hypothetical protein
VQVEEVQLSRADGFVVISRFDTEQVLGLAPVKRSIDDRAITVTLEKPLESTTRLLVVLHADNRDGRFDPATDPRVTEDDDETPELEVERITYQVR